jgi:hypothetical protein
MTENYGKIINTPQYVGTKSGKGRKINKIYFSPFLQKHAYILCSLFKIISRDFYTKDEYEMSDSDTAQYTNRSDLL